VDGWRAGRCGISIAAWALRYDPRATEPEEWSQTFNASNYFNEGWWRLCFAIRTSGHDIVRASRRC
jgi:hypothetical protein